MALDPAEFLDDLTQSEPPGTDPASQADDHLRAIKKAITQTFPVFDRFVAITPAEMQGIDARLTQLEADFAIPIVTSPVAGLTTVSDTDVIAVTGVGFQPAVIEITAVIENFGFGTIWRGVFDGTFNHGINYYRDHELGQPYQYYSEYITTEFWRLRGTGATVTSRGDLVSLDADGFTLKASVLSEETIIQWVAHPGTTP